eukprot:2168228-Alexandrium_andersonii.AAC.1
MVGRVGARVQKRELGRRTCSPLFAPRCRHPENAPQRMLEELALLRCLMNHTPRKKPGRQRVLRVRRWYHRRLWNPAIIRRMHRRSRQCNSRRLGGRRRM